TLLGGEHKPSNIDLRINEIRLELMLGYCASIDSLDERNTGVV
ncbi:6792_t:CDS:2, partial [Funneliformis mosseae]